MRSSGHVLRRPIRLLLAPVLLLVLAAAACSAGGPDTTEDPAPAGPGRPVGVQLFQWTWDAIGRECTDVLGPAGYGWVLTSPPQEHVLGPEWWTSYQPVSYRLESRLGTREEFARMVEACGEAGVDVVADAVVNHMTGKDEPGVGWAGSPYEHYDYPGLYAPEDFHHCRLTPDDDIADYRNGLQVQRCELVNLADLATETDHVRQTIRAYLDDLLSLGVAGFRIDAAKHIPVADLRAILDGLPEDVVVIQEVIRGTSEPIIPEHYLDVGPVFEFSFGRDVVGLAEGGSIKGFETLGTTGAYVPSESAVVFVDNHDTERNGSTLNYQQQDAYQLATLLMLAGGYGQPVVYSGYAFSTRDEGPRQTEEGVLDAECAGEAGPESDVQDGDWVCQHRWDAVLGMVGWRAAVGDAPVVHWWDDVRAIAFAREGRGFVVVNKDDEPLTGEWSTGLAPGTYCDVVSAAGQDVLGAALADQAREGRCPGLELEVDDDGVARGEVPPRTALAVHVGARR